MSRNSLREVVAFVALASLPLIFELAIHHAVGHVGLCSIEWATHCQLLFVNQSHGLQVFFCFVYFVPVHFGVVNLGYSIVSVRVVANDWL